ncbi:serine hydrolase domain-containing protein [Actinopolymorpha pittospori]
MLDITGLSDALSAEIPELLDTHAVPGMAVGVCTPTQVLWSAGFGTTNARGRTPVGTTTMFSVQSVSKTYTATAVMIAVKQGRVALDEPITTYLPTFTVRSRFEDHPERKMTLRHLLSHTAGFTHEAPVGSNYVDGGESFDEHCASISDTWLRFPVGHHYEYSNLGIDLAGAILQQVYDVPFHEFVRRELLAPLGLTRTTFDQEAIAAEEDRAIGHNRQVPQLPVRIPMVPAGGIYTSVDDALRYVQFHLRDGEKVLDKELLATMYRVPFPAPGQALGYGLGVQTSRWEPGVVVRHHGGGGFGFLCDVGWAPDPGVGVVVLTNSVDHPLTGRESLAQRIMREVVESTAASVPTASITMASSTTAPSTAATPAAPTRRAPVPASEAARFVGEYVSRGASLTRIRSEAGHLVWDEVGNDDPDQLRVTGRDEIVRENDEGATYRLVPGTDGAPAYLQCLDDGSTWYRNDRPGSRPGTAGPPLEARWHGSYDVRVNGSTVLSVELGVEDGASHLTVMGVRIWLDQIGPGLYSSGDGEVLDLTRTPPTCANIPLHRDTSKA